MYVQWMLLAVLLVMQFACAMAETNQSVVFTNNGKQYEVLHDVEPAPVDTLVTPPDPGTPLEATLQSQEQMPDREVIGNIGSLVLVKKQQTEAQHLTADGGDPARSDPSDSSQNVWYVRNLADKSLGIVNGDLFVELKDIGQAGAVADAYALRYLFALSGRSIAIMAADLDDGFLARLERLRADDRVVAVELQIVTHLPSPT